MIKAYETKDKFFYSHKQKSFICGLKPFEVFQI